jgi:hypothetical protein
MENEMSHQLNTIDTISSLRIQDVADLITWACEKHWPLESCVFKTDGEVHEIWFESQAISVDSLGQRFELHDHDDYGNEHIWRKV